MVERIASWPLAQAPSEGADGAGPSTLTVGVPEPQRTMTARDVSSPGLDSRWTAPAGTRRKSPGPASTTTSPPRPARHDVERRVVVTVVVPPGHRAGLGVDGARPHRLGVQGDLPAHPRRGVGGAEVVAGDVGARLGCEARRVGVLRHAPIKPPEL